MGHALHTLKVNYFSFKEEKKRDLAFLKLKPYLCYEPNQHKIHTVSMKEECYNYI